MQLTHETISRSETLPFHVFTFRAKDTSRMIPQHWHQSAELIYCLSGRLNVWIKGILYQMQPRDLLIINSNEIHATHSPVHNHVLCMQIPLPFLQQITDNQYDSSFRFQLNTIGKTVLNRSELQKQLDSIDHILEQSANDITLADRLRIQGIFYTFMGIIVAKHTAPIDMAPKSNAPEAVQMMTKATSYINDHFYERLTLQQIASIFNYSTSYFSRTFKLVFNMNFHDFLVSVRLNEAVKQLVTTNQTLNQIAMASGFENYRNFYNAFTQVYRITPGEYRKNAATASSTRPIHS